jgi:hypothetical protein
MVIMVVRGGTGREVGGGGGGGTLVLVRMACSRAQATVDFPIVINSNSETTV